jgi:hypothetical protein
MTARPVLSVAWRAGVLARTATERGDPFRRALMHRFACALWASSCRRLSSAKEGRGAPPAESARVLATALHVYTWSMGDGPLSPYPMELLRDLREHALNQPVAFSVSREALQATAALLSLIRAWRTFDAMNAGVYARAAAALIATDLNLHGYTDADMLEPPLTDAGLAASVADAVNAPGTGPFGAGRALEYLRAAGDPWAALVCWRARVEPDAIARLRDDGELEGFVREIVGVLNVEIVRPAHPRSRLSVLTPRGRTRFVTADSPDDLVTQLRVLAAAV